MVCRPKREMPGPAASEGRCIALMTEIARDTKTSPEVRAILSGSGNRLVVEALGSSADDLAETTWASLLEAKNDEVPAVVKAAAEERIGMPKQVRAMWQLGK